MDLVEGAAFVEVGLLRLLPAAEHLVDGEQLELGEPVRILGRRGFRTWAKEMLPRDVLSHLRIEIVQILFGDAFGPFALDDPNYVRDLLAQGGFTSTGFERWHGEQYVGGPGATPEVAADFVFHAMSIGRILESCAAGVQEQVRSALVALFDRHHDGSGVRMGGTAWLVRATA